MFEMTQPSLVFCDITVFDLVAECLKDLGNDAKVFTFNGTKGDSDPMESLFDGKTNSTITGDFQTGCWYVSNLNFNKN